MSILHIIIYIISYVISNFKYFFKFFYYFLEFYYYRGLFAFFGFEKSIFIHAVEEKLYKRVSVKKKKRRKFPSFLFMEFDA